VNWLGWLIAGLVLLLCAGTILAGLNTILVRGTTKSLKMNNIEIVGLVALILGSLLMCSAVVMFAVWVPGADNRWFSPIGVTGLIGLPMSLLGTFLIRNATNRLGGRQS